MREIIINSKKRGTHTVLVDDEDFGVVSGYNWILQNSPHDNTLYAVSATGNKKGDNHIRMHRLIINAPDGLEVDHKNGNGLDNRKENLRVCSHQSNGANRRKPKHNSTGYKGVSKKGRKFRSYLKVNYKQIYLGTFNTPAEAATSYNEAAKKYFGEFAKLNQL